MTFHQNLNPFIIILSCFIWNCNCDTCYQYFGYASYSFYCCGSCTGYSYQACDDGGTLYYYDYYVCYGEYWSAGIIVGVVIGSLVGLALLVSCVVCLICVCKSSSARQGRVITPSSQTAGVSVVSSFNTNSSYNSGHMMSTGPPQPMPDYLSPGYQPPRRLAPLPQTQNQYYPMSQSSPQTSQPQQPMNIPYPPPAPPSYDPLPPPTYAETTQNHYQ